MRNTRGEGAEGDSAEDTREVARVREERRRMGGWATWDEGEKRGCGRRNRCRGTKSRQHLAVRAAGARAGEGQSEGGQDGADLFTRYAPFSLLNAPNSSSRDTWVIMDDASI